MGVGTGSWKRDGVKEVGRGESQTHHLETGPDRVGRYPWGVLVSLGLPLGVMKSGVPMPFLLPSLKLECEKLASEKTEMQRHYVMVRGLHVRVGGVGSRTWL